MHHIAYCTSAGDSSGQIQRAHQVTIQPKISIIIPVYNGSNFLSDAIESALAQTYSNIEIIVVNDGSNDGGETERIALSFGERICYYAQKNGGVASALNLAVSKMTGEYFSWLSHDDLYYPNKVSVQMQQLVSMAERDRVILYGGYVVFSDTTTNNITEIRLPYTPPEQFRYFITTNNILHGCTLLVPKQAFKECGAFNEALRTTQDYDLWFRMAEKYRFTNMQNVLVKARAHTEQGSVKMKDVALKEINELLAGFVSCLTEKELTSATNTSVGLAYAGIAENFRMRGFLDAADFAQNLAWKNLTRGSWVDALNLLAILMKKEFLVRPFERMRRIFSMLCGYKYR